VAKMTELLLEKSGLTKVLEIGTGCGYQTAVLAQLVENVYTVERILPLQKKAQNYLANLALDNIHHQYNDGALGWAEYAPFDGILVSAAAGTVPGMLLQQLAIGGVMLIPIANDKGQVLQRITRLTTGYQVEDLEPVSFVPFLSGVE
jgi:protein-L-isoaspartate(D-aspartate) O-methyltransferase